MHYPSKSRKKKNQKQNRKSPKDISYYMRREQKNKLRQKTSGIQEAVIARVLINREGKENKVHLCFGTKKKTSLIYLCILRVFWFCFVFCAFKLRVGHSVSPCFWKLCVQPRGASVSCVGIACTTVFNPVELFPLAFSVSFLVMLDGERCCVQIICVCVCVCVFNGFH